MTASLYIKCILYKIKAKYATKKKLIIVYNNTIYEPP